MKFLKCADCGYEISITSEKCLNCGSRKQFKNYIFMRKELRKNGITPMEMMNFQKHGGKIKIINLDFKKLFKYLLILFVLLIGVSFFIKKEEIPKKTITLKDGTVITITEKELKLRDTIKNDIKPFQYDLLEEAYNKLLEEDSKKIYKDNYELFKKVNMKSWDCKVRVQERDKNTLKLKDTYNIVAGKSNRLEGWTDTHIFTYVYQFKAKNEFGMELTHESSNKCTYDDDFKLIKIEKLN